MNIDFSFYTNLATWKSESAEYAVATIIIE